MTLDITSTHPYTDNHTDQLTAWLTGTPHHWDYDGDLVIDTPDGQIYPRPGWLLIRWTDNAVTTATPRIAERIYGPQGLLGQAQDTVTRVRALADSWAKAGPPPLGTSVSRWVDARLIELNAALDQTTEH
ncbi:hypothetical protein PV728_01625 [Streptomyces europaeiscabiei]|uniref:hypothetical protein n=1 Tax=Streptomyces europaeiscabiei TaxID=146819 RepID=UPI0029AF443C|nr:hypothetical protein [Streptomyces europaeiscabiei]MDX3629028.1 hypothetical protein [Streptomyces europaeiscabiei]MDX3647354.1 hypothetical protein [Streptomyces europaeiscabiei]